MAVDKLVDSAQLESGLTDIADAIRAKTGKSESIEFPDGFVSEIESIETGGGGYTIDSLADGSEPSGNVSINTATLIVTQAFSGNKALREVTSQSVKTINGMAFNTTNITKVSFPECTKMGAGSTFAWSTKLTEALFPKLTGWTNISNFQGCSALKLVDYGMADNVNTNTFATTALETLILRKTSTITTLANINAFNSSPFASGKSGGTLYVPAALISSYESATNWSAILGYENNSIQAIEGSIYETQYADGTPIQTT